MSTNTPLSDRSTPLIQETVLARGTITPERVPFFFIDTFEREGDYDKEFVGNTGESYGIGIEGIMIEGYDVRIKEITITDPIGYEIEVGGVHEMIEGNTITPKALMPELDTNTTATIRELEQTIHELEQRLLYKSYEFLPIWALATILSIFVLSLLSFTELVAFDIVGPMIFGLILLSIAFIRFWRNMKS